MAKSEHALCAQAIRKELKNNFPATKFSVTSESYSMGNNVNVYWTDGESREAVYEIIKKYQYGHFDGMTDSYEHSNKIKNIPQVKFVFANRRKSQ